MKQTQLIMGMPITVEILAREDALACIQKVFTYFRQIDNQFSPFKKDSEVSRVNQGLVALENTSESMQEILALAEKTRKQTNGYFFVAYPPMFDPSGVVKGWAIQQASRLLEQAGCTDYFIEAGGDIQTNGANKQKTNWRVGIRNPFQPETLVKVVQLHNQGIATSGNYFRGNHIYMSDTDIVSTSVIGPNVLEADRFATAAFAMGRQGIYFLERLPGLEGYMIDKDGKAMFTSGFKEYCQT